MVLNVDGYDIHYKLSGDGEDTVVILQGWGTHYDVYDLVAGAICSRYRVLQFDLPGFGESDEPREPWGVDDFADFFLSFMGAMGISRATLIGHSFGGRIIIKLLARENLPLEVDRAVLIDSAGVMPKKTARQKFRVKKYKALKKIFDIDAIYKLCPEAIDEWRSRQGSADYRNATPMMRQCLVRAVNEDLTDLFDKNKIDTLLIWGDQDTATPLSDGKLMESRMPGAGLAVIEGAGHFCFLDSPAVFSRIMKSYFGIRE